MLGMVTHALQGENLESTLYMLVRAIFEVFQKVCKM